MKLRDACSHHYRLNREIGTSRLRILADSADIRRLLILQRCGLTPVNTRGKYH